MPKILISAMRAHLEEETTQLAAIWRITRKDGAQFFFTDHDRDIVFGGDTYRADAGFARTAIRSDAGFAVDNLDLVGGFAEGGIVEDEVRAGLLDGAEIRVSFVKCRRRRADRASLTAHLKQPEGGPATRGRRSAIRHRGRREPSGAAGRTEARECLAPMAC
jgi:uncharacterized phage protein (TIGR02218 family)